MALTAVEQTLLELLEIDSPTGGEAPLAEVVEGWCVDAGWRVRRHGLCLVVDRPELGPPRIGFFGHLDVVTDREMAPIATHPQWIHGPGASDMKSGLAVMMELIRNLPPSGVRAEPVFVFYDAEEGPIAENGLAPALDHFSELRELELGVCMEPTANALQLGCVGSLHVRLTVSGQAGHSARPWEGVNAITKAGALLTDLGTLKPRSSLCEGLEFFDTFTVTLAQGGHSRNSVPASLSMNLNLRFVPGRTAQQAFDEIVAWVGDRAQVEWVDASASAPVARTTPLLKQLVEIGQLEREAKQAWTDVAQLAACGIPGVNFGPGDPAWAHQAGERIRRADLNHSLSVINRWLCAH